MKQQLENIRVEALNKIGKAEASQTLESIRVKYLGKKGEKIIVCTK